MKDGEKFQRGVEKFQRKKEGGLVGPLCSRNPHDETVVVRRAQWWTKPGHPPRGGASELGGSILLMEAQQRPACIDDGILRFLGLTLIANES